jgi:hypothetical protein
MKSEDQIWELYGSNLVSVIEDITTSIKIDGIRDNSFAHVFARIKQFEQSYLNEDVRRSFIEKIFKNIKEAEFLILDSNFIQKEPRHNLLIEIKETIKKIFPEIKIIDKHGLTSTEKVILLNYLGVLDYLRGKGINETNLASLLSLLVDRSDHNIEEAIRNINYPPKKGNIKNSKSLNTVKEVVTRLKITPIIEKVEDDLIILKKSR